MKIWHWGTAEADCEERGCPYKHQPTPAGSSGPTAGQGWAQKTRWHSILNTLGEFVDIRGYFKSDLFIWRYYIHFISVVVHMALE